MEKKETIIFVDDEKYWSGPYVRELEKTYEVLYRKTAVAGREAVLAHSGAKLLVLDIMMPPPSEVPESETESGLATGIWLLEEVRKVIIERPLPVIVFTNRNVPAVEQGLADVPLPKGLLVIHSKIDTPKFYLPHLVGGMIDKHRAGKK
jgi:CheY-like chemotaxis protein